MAVKKARTRIVIDEEGNASVDILCGEGPSCAKEAAEWSALFGGDVVSTKKPEYFKQTKKSENLNTQKKG